MSTPSTQELVQTFTRSIEVKLDPSRLDGLVRMDNTHTVVIIPIRGMEPIFVHARAGVGEDGVQDVLTQIQMTPGLKGLVSGR